MRSNTVILAALPLVASAASTSGNWGGGVNYSKIFGGGLSANASIHYPGQPDYNTTTVQRWSTWAEPTFAVTIKPATDEDVQYIIRTANKYNLTFLATGGGHGGETGFATVKHAVNIDLSNFKENVLDLEANTLTVGPGNSFSAFETNLYNAGKMVPVGNAFCVNMIGATIGAGVGPYQGLHGLVIDALRSVRLVTASGDIVTASDEENPDLFWAVRGAGANFGIITSATYEIFDAPNNGNVVLAEFAYPGSVNGSLWQLLESWGETYPKEMGLTMSASYSQTTGTTSSSASLTYFGTQEAAQPWIDQLLALNPTQWRNATLPWSEVSQNSGFGTGASVCATGKYNNHPSVGAKQTSVSTYIEVFNQYVEIMKARPWLTSALVVQRFNTTATLAVPESKRGVYPGRDFSSLIILENYYDGPRHDADVYRFSKKLRSQLVATSGFDSLQTYINYAHGDEGPEVWYGKDNLPRLVQLKRQWDPEGKFGPGNPIPLA
ncbi:conserved hypothetical protein [Aspergillus terreus NIH2624]|uniref:FAD-linked oxidoreductase tazL n=1 Tax=Aspergillus terreus (strain NIH 2624 / FGSC A1156) TaxID=341663 RepID=TAZL_ASPTN|nr:uncharacterized protein ATEG_03442 [Aspergillus terreus NIH2624]Q0CS92.1 RecName: Full=FAD-linked oxidoreductase tazL; AltName: Full=Azaphilone biosynthesis cluster protein L; Flags: Precursor [Aspergillus terreus NIH2624]EAU36716.1 conserved hypothetical protein [Aspergillus terreus NIH2624]